MKIGRRMWTLGQHTMDNN